MCYRLRTLLIVLTVLPPMLAGACFVVIAFASPMGGGSLGSGPLMAAGILLVLLTLAIERG